MEIRILRDSERFEALRLAREVFLSFEAPEYSEEGVWEFLGYLDGEARIHSLQMFGAFLRGGMAGMLAMAPNGHISLFFVAERFHRQGIGRALFHAVLNEYAGQRLTVNSSPYAVPVYRRLGFADTDCEQCVNGIRYTPMTYPGETFHSYLFESGKWYAEGTYFDAHGQSFPLSGEVELVREEGRWILGGWMEVRTAPPLRFTNDYKIQTSSHSGTLIWESFNPALGAMRGTFELIGKYVLSSYRSEDGRYSGAETLIRTGEASYENFGAAFDGKSKMSSWIVRIKRVSS